MADMQFTAVFWNIHKFKAAGSDEWAGRLDLAAATLKELGGGEPPGLIGLCEIHDDSALSGLAERLGGVHGYEFGGSAGGRWPGDVGVLYHRELFEPPALVEEYPPPGGPDRCRGASMRLGLRGRAEGVQLSVHHWPWPLYKGPVDLGYHRLACRQWLWDRRCPRLPGDVAIAMGDFNVPPYDSLWDGGGLATRYATEARQQPESLLPLYNTGWRFLQDPLRADGSPVHGGASWPETRGSFREPDGSWHLWDQLLVSGQALGGGPLRLVEDSVCYAAPDGISHDPEGTGVRQPLRWSWDAAHGSGRGMSDHFPVLARFECAGPGDNDGRCE